MGHTRRVDVEIDAIKAVAVEAAKLSTTTVAILPCAASDRRQAGSQEPELNGA